MSNRVNTKYPNLPDEFRDLVKQARRAQNITMAVMGLDLGTYPATISQLERGSRNFNYERAVQFRDYLKMDYELPIPRPEEAEHIRRPRNIAPIEINPFYICVDGEIIQVIKYRRIGKITKHKVYNKKEQ